MKLLRLTPLYGHTMYLSAAAFAATYAHPSGGTYVSTIGSSSDWEFLVSETPDEIAAMLAEPPQKTAMEAAAPQMLEALKSLFDESISHAESRKIVRAAITKAEGRA